LFIIIIDYFINKKPFIMPTKIEDLVQKKDEIRASLDELSKAV
jgi:hypothetical protein